MFVIAVSGTPGTGKTTLAKRIASACKYTYVDVNRVITKHRLSEGYDPTRKTKIVDVKKLNRVLIQMIKESKTPLVIDSHLSHNLPPKHVDLVVITKASIRALRRRLPKRGYSKSKIQENIDAEIFDVCRNEAEELGHKIVTVDTSKPYSLRSLTRKT